MAQLHQFILTQSRAAENALRSELDSNEEEIHALKTQLQEQQGISAKLKKEKDDLSRISLRHEKEREKSTGEVIHQFEVVVLSDHSMVKHARD